jgi:hypothetical protein
MRARTGVLAQATIATQAPAVGFPFNQQKLHRRSLTLAGNIDIIYQVSSK